MDVLNQISEIGVVPVITLKSVEEVEPLLEALSAGDVKVAELCFRTECAADCIKVAAEKFPDFLVGAGTVINKEQCEKAIEYGAKFIVSPGTSDAVAECCKAHNIPYLPGVVTPTEVMHCIDLGYKTLKFFPAGVYGGLKAIDAIGAAFPQVKFVTTGGVDLNNLREFISNKRIVACCSSFLTKGSYEDITKACLEARKIVKEVRG